MPLEPGSRLDAFELVALLGRGGMDEVWRAIDTTLARHVAVKRLPAEFIGDPLRVSRFEREARVASSLTHPNICHIYALGHAGGEQRYIAMEYVEGRTLRAQLHDSRFGLRQAIDVCAQIASGASAAHAAGVIHRDLKPENVVIRPDDLVKVLDFGLANRDGQHLAARGGIEVVRVAALSDAPRSRRPGQKRRCRIASSPRRSDPAPLND